MGYSPPEEPVDEPSFRSALETIITTGRKNDVEVQRYWSLRDGPSTPGWDVEIVRVGSGEGDDDQ